MQIGVYIFAGEMKEGKAKTIFFMMAVAVTSLLIASMTPHHHHHGAACAVVVHCLADNEDNDEHTGHKGDQTTCIEREAFVTSRGVGAPGAHHCQELATETRKAALPTPATKVRRERPWAEQPAPMPRVGRGPHATRRGPPARA